MNSIGEAVDFVIGEIHRIESERPGWHKHLHPGDGAIASQVRAIARNCGVEACTVTEAHIEQICDAYTAIGCTPNRRRLEPVMLGGRIR